ncbi:MAG: protease PrsW [Candidatus Thermoplasmatota archaeon]|nr:protease PrsW [Candidatus Thermoplasmatota archaeon]
MNTLPSASLFIGIIPALALLFYSIKGYDGLYKEKTIFITFVAGIITGFIAIIIEWYTIGVGIFFIILFPMLEQLFKTIALNLRFFHDKRETVIYGFCLGLGFGSIFTPFSIIVLNFNTDADIILLSLSVLGSIGIILMHASTGICLGYGVYKNNLPKYLIFAIVLQIPVTALVFTTTYYATAYLQILIIPYGLAIYWYTTTKIMAKILIGKEKRSKK